ncbi:unnamed protein product [Notodromas monacha]|uniref:Uncharacterized protein n=1 Tax=Notodromas monacha TaxID=399045 RepID=A0A7R9BJC1_9CRUS|nr:unnamed protein product [Notodromas monacha]CAG0916552.1 unnamed protein product [Notodromas monacha]
MSPTAAVAGRRRRRKEQSTAEKKDETKSPLSSALIFRLPDCDFSLLSPHPMPILSRHDHIMSISRIRVHEAKRGMKAADPSPRRKRVETRRKIFVFVLLATSFRTSSAARPQGKWNGGTTNKDHQDMAIEGIMGPRSGAFPGFLFLFSGCHQQHLARCSCFRNFSTPGAGIALRGTGVKFVVDGIELSGRTLTDMAGKGGDHQQHTGFGRTGAGRGGASASAIGTGGGLDSWRPPRLPWHEVQGRMVKRLSDIALHLLQAKHSIVGKLADDVPGRDDQLKVCKIRCEQGRWLGPICAALAGYTSTFPLRTHLL